MSAMTREERNARRSSLRYQHLNSIQQSRVGMICEFFRRAKKEKLTQKQMLNYRNDWVYGKDWAKLPAWLQNHIMGAWDACSYELKRKCPVTDKPYIVFCYSHPLTGVITDSHTICNEGLASQIPAEHDGAFWWRNEDGSFTHKYF